MKNWNIDVAVLCIFFNRPEQFRISFQQVRQARPRVLLLWQDGPRKGRTDDVENIMLCRSMLDECIDWECEVHRSFHEENMGCDPSTFNAHQWAFSIVDKCIILEDDLVVSQSFFPFCKELLDRYENDWRVDRICGQNLLEINDECPYDYFYSTRGSSWGWASWRRVAETWNRNYEFLDTEYYRSILSASNDDKRQSDIWISGCQKHKEMGVPYWEEIIGARSLLYNGLVIFPKYNMVNCVGASENATHALSDISLLPPSSRFMFEIKRYELSFPLKHPPYMIEDKMYAEKCRELIIPTKKAEILRRKAESILHKIKTGTFWVTVKRKLKEKRGQ